MDVFPTFLMRQYNMNVSKEITEEIGLQLQKIKVLHLMRIFLPQTPNYGEFHTTVFNEQFKLVQIISSSLLKC